MREYIRDFMVFLAVAGAASNPRALRKEGTRDASGTSGDEDASTHKIDLCTLAHAIRIERACKNFRAPPALPARRAGSDENHHLCRKSSLDRPVFSVLSRSGRTTPMIKLIAALLMLMTIEVEAEAGRHKSTYPVERTSNGRIKRTSSARRFFMRSTGHQHGWPGHEVDHIVPLSKGGADEPENMQWLTVEEHARKTAAEQ
jgi:hypothetical protein